MTPRVGYETMGRVAERCNRIQYKVEKGDLDANRVMNLLDQILAGNITLAQTVTVAKEDLPYAKEKIDTNRTYPSDYKARPAEQLAKFWKKHYKKLDNSHVDKLSSGVLPSWADGWLVCPKPTSISDIEEVSGEEPPSFDNHWRSARGKILDLLKKVRRNFRNWLEGKLGPEYSRLTDLTAEVLERLCKETPGDFLVIPFQSGFRWRGCSVRHVCVRFEQNEFGMCSFLAGCLLASHPERISANNQLYLDCSGEERSPNGDGVFSYAPRFFWGGGELPLVEDCLSRVYDDFGSASCSAPVSAP